MCRNEASPEVKLLQAYLVPYMFPVMKTMWLGCFNLPSKRGGCCMYKDSECPISSCSKADSRSQCSAISFADGANDSIGRIAVRSATGLAMLSGSKWKCGIWRSPRTVHRVSRLSSWTCSFRLMRRVILRGRIGVWKGIVDFLMYLIVPLFPNCRVLCAMILPEGVHLGHFGQHECYVLHR